MPYGYLKKDNRPPQVVIYSYWVWYQNSSQYCQSHFWCMCEPKSHSLLHHWFPRLPHHHPDINLARQLTSVGRRSSIISILEWNLCWKYKVHHSRWWYTNSGLHNIASRGIFMPCRRGIQSYWSYLKSSNGTYPWMSSGHKLISRK